MDKSDHQLLAGGNVADRVLRIDSNARKPGTSATESVEAFLEHLHAKGFSGAPRTLGRDEESRHILEYIHGSTVDDPIGSKFRPVSYRSSHSGVP